MNTEVKVISTQLRRMIE